MRRSVANIAHGRVRVRGQHEDLTGPAATANEPNQHGQRRGAVQLCTADLYEPPVHDGQSAQRRSERCLFHDQCGCGNDAGGGCNQSLEPVERSVHFARSICKGDARL